MSTPLWLLSFCGAKTSSISANAQPWVGEPAQNACVDHCMMGSGILQLEERVFQLTLRTATNATPDLEMRTVGFKSLGSFAKKVLHGRFRRQCLRFRYQER